MLLMEWLAEFGRRLGMLLGRGQSDRDVEEEMRLHRDLKEQELLRAGVASEEAHYAAQRQLGNTLRLREESYDAWGWAWLEHLAQDLRLGLRRLRKNPGFTVVAVATLALGIGANTGIFTLLHAVMLKSLLVAKPSQLYRVGRGNQCCVITGLQGNFGIFSYPLYLHLRDHTPDFVELAAFQAGLMHLSVRRSGFPGAAQPYLGEFVSGNYFTMFGINASTGRTLTAADDRPNAPPMAMMSYRAWRERYALDPSVIGASFTINGVPATVAGVAPPGFFGDTLRSDPPDFWIPLAAEPLLHGQTSLLNHADAHWLYLIGRLNPASRPEQMQTRLTVEVQQWLRDQGHVPAQFQSEISKQKMLMTPAGGGVARLQRDYADGLRLLMIVSGLVLLIACANIANLLLARDTANRLQIAVRVALGATRARLARQTLTEGILLAMLGGAVGLAVAFASTRAILLLAFRGADYVPIDPKPSLPVLAFAFGLALLTGVIFAVAPAWITSQASPAEPLRGAGRSTRDRSSLPRKSLIVLQAALSVVLLAGAGLLTQSLRRIEHQQFGFQTQGRLIVKVDPALAGYTPERLAGLYRELMQRLTQIPGVLSASFSLYSPMEGNNWSSGISIEGRPQPTGPGEGDFASWDRVGPHYFETIGTHVLRGRAIDEQDTPASRHIAVVNEAFARKFFPNQNPLGKHLGIGGGHSADFEIVGIVEDAKYQEAREAAWPTIFLPLLQMANYTDPTASGTQTRSNYISDIELHVVGRPENLEPLIRRILADMDRNFTVLGMRSFGEQLSRNFNQERLIARLTTLYGFLALVLACIGLYGVAAYTVVRRTSEIGVRMALGASRRRVVAMVLQGALGQIALGLLIGIPIALAGGRALTSQLYDVKSYDPMVFGGAVLVLTISALLAGLIPALRAASIDPMQALRIE